MRVILGAALAAAIIFHHVPSAGAQTAPADASPPGWELVVMPGTVSALMPPGAAKVTTIEPGETDGGTILVSVLGAYEAGIEYSVTVSAAPRKVRGMSPADIRARVGVVITGLLGGPGRDVIVPAGLTSPALEGWRDGPDHMIRFYRVILDGYSMVVVSARGISHSGAETAIRRFANSVKLEHPLPTGPLADLLAQRPLPPMNPAGLAAATPAPPSAPPSSAVSDRISLISKAIREYPGRNSGPLSAFAGIYDLAKSCDAQRGLQNFSVALKGLLFAGKQVIWFEGNVMASVGFSNPGTVSRTQLTFQRDFPVEGGVVKIYEIAYSDRSSQRIGFFKDMMMFDPTISDNQIDFEFSKRCHNEAELLEWVKKVAELHD
jgi:hypothetical protein